MATVARLLPRYWDGRRLLQFLAGLALIALAFALPSVLSPSDAPAESPVTIVTTVDTPVGPAVPLIEAPAPTRPGGNQAGLALSGPEPANGAAEAAEAAQTAETGRTAGAARTVKARTAEAARTAGTAQAVEAAEATQSAEAAQSAEATHAAEGGAPALGQGDAGTVRGETDLPVQSRHGGREICAEARAAGGGVTQRAHGQRGPPRA